MNPTDIPTKLMDTAPPAAIPWGGMTRNQCAELLAHFWPAIEQHIRGQIADEINTAADRVFAQYPDVIAMSARGLGLRAAARIARGDTHQPKAIDIPTQHDGAHDQINHDAYTL